MKHSGIRVKGIWKTWTRILQGLVKLLEILEHEFLKHGSGFWEAWCMILELGYASWGSSRAKQWLMHPHSSRYQRSNPISQANYIEFHQLSVSCGRLKDWLSVFVTNCLSMSQSLSVRLCVSVSFSVCLYRPVIAPKVIGLMTCTRYQSPQGQQPLSCTS